MVKYSIIRVKGEEAMSGHNPEVVAVDVTQVDSRTDEEKIATAIVPYARDDARARYLGLRASGFTIREALKLIGYAHSTLSKWRLDSRFVDIETRLPEYRAELSKEYANLEFLRNYRLVLEKDFRILKRSLNPQYADFNGDKIEIPLTKQDQEYLIKMRTHYTPQQLQIIEALVSGNGKDDSFDFTKFVIEASRTVERVRVEGKKIPAIESEDEDNGS